MQETLKKFDSARYRLIAWCVMPNHVHVLIDPSESLAKIVQSWKSYTGRWILARDAELGLGVPGKECWMREYWDRYIRDEHHLGPGNHYIHTKSGESQAPPRPIGRGSAQCKPLQGTLEPQLGS